MLFKRDKKRESEINSLHNIAEKLTLMLQVSEHRYKNSKKPKLEIEIERFEKEKLLRIKFRNINSNTTIKRFAIKTEFPDVSYSHEPVKELKGEQLFSADLLIKQFKFSKMTLGVEYETEEGYDFFHYLSLDWFRSEEKYIFHVTPLMDKTHFQYLANS